MAPWFYLSPLSFSLLLLPLERRADRKCKLPPISTEFYKDNRQTISQVTPRGGPLLPEIRQIWWGRGMALGREMSDNCRRGEQPWKRGWNLDLFLERTPTGGWRQWMGNCGGWGVEWVIAQMVLGCWYAVRDDQGLGFLWGLKTYRALL